ncbi:hypothetical protein FRC01_006008 [Tulasnella sp. 417]|nr:hypothetical protein FRC01_006008 [Tulasnella sp. 417]
MRKGRGSTKVPGVKLKAVPSNASSKRRVEDSYSDNDEQDPLGDISLNDTKPPFDGLVLCCTGIKEKNVLFEQAKILGATTSKDFTVTVTHLIADGPGSAKYQCALERRIPIMDSKWVANTYARWQNGESVLLKETIERHRLPPFMGLKIAITGENDVTRRTELAKLIQRHGGLYSKQLNHNVTHLVVCCKSDSAANDSEKVKWARGANMDRKKSGVQFLIQLIWEEWLFDSIDWQGKWEETDYRIENPRPSRKILPEQEVQETPFFDPPSFRDCVTSTQRPTGSNSLHKSSADPGPSRLAQSSGGSRGTLGPNGEDQPEIAQIRRDHPSRPKDVLVNRLWADIVVDAKAGSGDLKGKGKAVIRPKRIAVGDETEDEEEEAGGRPLAAESTNDGDGEGAQRPSYLARMNSTRGLSFAAPSNPARRPPIVQAKTTERREAEPAEEGKVFSGLKFRTLGQAARDVAVKALEDNGGVVIRDAAEEGLEEIDYVIVRLHEAPQFVSPNDPHFSKFRTECWVEHSIWEERLCDTSEQVGFTPFSIATPVPGADTIRLSYSGLDSAQVTTVKRVCRALGINVPDIFSKTVTHLICPGREGAKYDKALSWNIEVVDLNWLWAIARSGRVEGHTPETVESKQQSPIADITNTSSGELESRRSDSKTDEDKPIKQSPSKAISSESTSIPTRLLSVSPSKGLTVPSPSTAQSPNPGSATPLASAGSAQLGSAIAAMLGKRSSEEQEQGPEPPKKKSKRPARTRAMADGNRLSASVSPARLGTSFVPPIHTMPETAFDELQEELGPDSMLVSYEDPAQKAQKMKIMALIKGETPPLPVVAEEERRRRLPRKSRNAAS